MIDEISDRKSSSRKEKPEKVDIKTFVKEGKYVYGLGTDNNVYKWCIKEAVWTLFKLR